MWTETLSCMVFEPAQNLFALNIAWDILDDYYSRLLISDLPDLKSTTAFKQANSASPTCRLRKRALISWSMRMSAMVATIFSAGVLSTCMPAAARSGATSKGIFHWTAPIIKSSLHPSSNKITWSRKGRFTNDGMFLAHFTEINSRRAADSQIASGVEEYSEVVISCCGV